MRRLLIFSLASACVIIWVSAFLLFRQASTAADLALPTLLLIPSATPTSTDTPTDAPTVTQTPTPSPTETVSPSQTPEIPASVVETEAPTNTPTSTPTMPAVLPPMPIEPLPDATHSAPPFLGWNRFESDHPNMQYLTPWTRHLDREASRGQYHQTAAGGAMRFVFEGEAVRVRYAAEARSQFSLLVDGVPVAVLESGPEFNTSPIYALTPGSHWLEIRALNGVVRLDAVDVFRSTQAIISLAVYSPTPSQTTQEMTPVSATATVEPTNTPQVLRAGIVIAYDENGNRTVDPAEGVIGVSVRVVDTTTNRVIASGFTDQGGYAQFDMVLEAPARIVVPYFGKSWEWQNERNGVSSYVLLLTPGNQPGLIP